jgi:hypothetical protein
MIYYFNMMSGSHPEHFYIVGATKGDLGGIKPSGEIVETSLQAFVMKMKVSSLRAQWTVSLGAKDGQNNDPTATYALGCAVSDDVVYIVGTVESGASMVLGDEVNADPFGQDAVYLVGKTMGEIRDLSPDEQLPAGSTHAFITKNFISIPSLSLGRNISP